MTRTTDLLDPRLPELDSRDVASLRVSVARVREIRRRVVRRAVLDEGRVEVLADICGYEVEDFHRDIWDLQESTPAGESCFATAPRGGGKSTIGTILRILYEIVLDPDIEILLGSNTAAQSEVFLREIKAQFMDNLEFRFYFGDFYNDAQSAATGRAIKWDGKEIVVAMRARVSKQSTVTCLGVGGPVVGRHYDLHILDDVVDEENAKTDGQRSKVKTWHYKTVEPALRPPGRSLRLGTLYHPLDLYHHWIKNDCRRRYLNVPAIATEPGQDLSEGRSFWEPRFSLEFLLRKLQRMGSAIFFSQFMGDTKRMHGGIFKEENHAEYTKFPDMTLALVFMGLDPAHKKGDIDLSLHEDEGENDYWTAFIGVRLVVEGKIGRELYLVDGFRVHCSKGEYVRRVGVLAHRWQPTRIGLEVQGAQEYLVEDLEEFGSIKRIERTTDKITRAYWLQGYHETKRILFPSRELAGNYDLWQIARDELTLFPKADKDDCFDGIQTLADVAFEIGDDFEDDEIEGSVSLWDDDENYQPLKGEVEQWT